MVHHGHEKGSLPVQCSVSPDPFHLMKFSCAFLRIESLQNFSGNCFDGVDFSSISPPVPTRKLYQPEKIQFMPAYQAGLIMQWYLVVLIFDV